MQLVLGFCRSGKDRSVIQELLEGAWEGEFGLFPWRGVGGSKNSLQES